MKGQMEIIKERLRRRLLGQNQAFEKAVEKFPFGQRVEPHLLRERINREDGLINSRTSIFLVLNGLAAVAVTNLRVDSGCCWLASLLAIVVNILWFYCSRQSLKVLAAVTRGLLKVAVDEPMEKLVQQVLGSCHFGRPNTILGVYLPGLAVISWLAVFLATSPWFLRLAVGALVVIFVLRELVLLLQDTTNPTPQQTAQAGTPEEPKHV